MTDNKSRVDELRKSIDLSKLSKPERKHYIKKLFVWTPLLNKISADFAYHRSEADFYSAAQSFYICGPSGVGKTFICKKYAENFPRYDVEMEDRIQTIVPVYISKVEATATPKSLATALLRDLGDPLYSQGTEQNKTDRLVELVRDCQVEMIIIDEVQHIYDRDSDKIIIRASNWLKNFMADTAIPIILVGLPDIKTVIKDNKQLETRFKRKHELKPLSMNRKKGDVSEFEKFLHLVDLKLPLEKRSHLADRDTAVLLYEATKGNLRILMESIIQNAAIKAINNDFPAISFEMLKDEIDCIDDVEIDEKVVEASTKKKSGKGRKSKEKTYKKSVI